MDIPKSSDLFEMDLTPDEARIVDDFIPVKKFVKGQVLLKEGDVPTAAYYVIKGLVRAYIVTDEGEERTVDFFMENDAINPMGGFLDEGRTTRTLVCEEESVMCVITKESEDELIARWPVFETLCRVEVEKYLGEAQEKMMKFLTSPPEKRYADLLKERPGLVQRVPQYMLASYLGIKPESLSRIRKRLVKHR